MNDDEALDAARRNIDDAIDALDTLDEQSTSSVVAVALLTGARVCVNARLAAREDEGA